MHQLKSGRKRDFLHVPLSSLLVKKGLENLNTVQYLTKPHGLTSTQLLHPKSKVITLSWDEANDYTSVSTRETTHFTRRRQPKIGLSHTEKTTTDDELLSRKGYSSTRNSSESLYRKSCTQRGRGRQGSKPTLFPRSLIFHTQEGKRGRDMKDPGNKTNMQQTVD